MHAFVWRDFSEHVRSSIWNQHILRFELREEESRIRDINQLNSVSSGVVLTAGGKKGVSDGSGSKEKKAKTQGTFSEIQDAPPRRAAGSDVVKSPTTSANSASIKIAVISTLTQLRKAIASEISTAGEDDGIIMLICFSML
jgi:hypothetical protein